MCLLEICMPSLEKYLLTFSVHFFKCFFDAELYVFFVYF